MQVVARRILEEASYELSKAQTEPLVQLVIGGS